MCEISSCGHHNDLPAIEVSKEQRRLFLKGMLSLPLATVLAYPEFSRAAANKTETIHITTSGGKDVSAAIAMPDNENAPAVLLIHEWWGLNDQIKSVAVELANQGFVALAVDLYNGEVATTRDKAKSLTQSVDAAAATDTLQSWIQLLKNHSATNGKVATMGWCFGGGWSLNASLSSPVDATVIYYGNVKKSKDELSALQSPVMGHFATEDQWINKEMVDGFESSMAAAGKSDDLQVFWYEANHAFANPTSARYDQEDAATAWDRTLEFLRTHTS